MPTNNSIGGKVTGKLAKGSNTILVSSGSRIAGALTLTAGAGDDQLVLSTADVVGKVSAKLGG